MLCVAQEDSRHHHAPRRTARTYMHHDSFIHNTSTYVATPSTHGPDTNHTVACLADWPRKSHLHLEHVVASETDCPFGIQFPMRRRVAHTIFRRLPQLFAVNFHDHRLSHVLPCCTEGIMEDILPCIALRRTHNICQCVHSHATLILSPCCSRALAQGVHSLTFYCVTEKPSHHHVTWRILITTITFHGSPPRTDDQSRRTWTLGALT